MTGHITEKCYKLHGYPVGHKFHKKNPPHTTHYAHLTTIDSNIPSDDGPIFNKEQYQKLLTLLHSKEVSVATHSINTVQTACPSSPIMNGTCFSLTSFIFAQTTETPSPWIIDTGATDHMVCNTSHFSSITFKISLVVKLPNGDSVPTTHLGTIQITCTLILHNVICVSFFIFNLNSTKQLTSTLSCCFVLLSQFCFMQDLLTLTTIGMSEMKGGLYHLLDAPVSSLALLDCFYFSLHKKISNSTVSKQSNLASNLWHYRMGHIPISKLLVIKDPMIK